MKALFEATEGDLRRRIAAHETRLAELETKGGRVLLRKESEMLAAAKQDLEKFLLKNR